MFGGKRLKRTCLASNSSAVMSLKLILCDGQHEHAPWSINNGVFDTSLEAEYTPCLAKALATAILEGISGQYKLPHVAQYAKKLKLSHFHAIAAAKQPTRALQLSTVPEFSHIVVLSNLPCHVTFSISNSVLQQCLSVTWLQQACTIPCQSRLLRATNKKGGEIRRFKLSVEHTQTLRSLSDTGQNGSSDAELQLRKCAKCGDKCTLFHLSWMLIAQLGIAVTGFLVLDGRQRNLYLRRLQWDIHLWFFLGCRRKSKMLACMLRKVRNLW